MESHQEYIKSILEKILSSYKVLTELDDKQGDLEIIKKESSKINGFLRVIINKLTTEKGQMENYKKLKLKSEKYLENYYFIKEIDTMDALYSDDKDRLKNIRLKIIESLEDNKLLDEIKYTLEKL